jgi:hypothetical protein
MANAAKARETLRVIRENPERLYMGAWAQGEVNPNASHWSECGTTFCYFGWRCVLDGLRPEADSFGDATGRFIAASGESVGPLDHGRASLELTVQESRAIAYRHQITNVGDLEWLVEAVLDDDWDYCSCVDPDINGWDPDSNGCEDCHYRGIIRPSEQVGVGMDEDGHER